MAIFTIISTIVGTLGGGLATTLTTLLKDTSVVLILLGVSLGWHFGDEYGRWRQTSADAAAVKHAAKGDTPGPRAVHPLRDFLKFVTNDPADAEND